MKKSTLVSLVLAAVFITAGWLLYSTIGIWLIGVGAVFALAALISALRMKRDE